VAYKDFEVEEEYHDDWDKFDIWRYARISETSGLSHVR
jgi:Na+-transporting NADH:ubiquinone oxidoreductase subunit F